MVVYIFGKTGKTNTRMFRYILKGGSESVKTLYMYVMELKHFCKNFTRLQRCFGVRNMLSCDKNTLSFACNYTSLFLIPKAKKRDNSCHFDTLSV